MTTPITREELSRSKLLAGMSDAQLDWLAEHATREEYAAGARVFDANDPADSMFLVLDGTLELYFELGGQQLLVATTTPGGATGMLPFSRMTTYNVRSIAATALVVLRVRRDVFGDLMLVSPELGQRLVAMMSDRVREATRMQEQREKMTALGKLSAGLAHELNNPAAAVRRAASALRERLTELPALTSKLAAHALTTDQVCAADVLRERAAAEATPARSALERAEREESVTEWLEQRAVPEAWKLAPAFAETVLDVADLERATQGLAPAAAADLLAWLAAGIEGDRLVDQIRHSAERISELVASVKSYSHMDRAVERQPTNVHAGIDNTLTMLGHKVRRKGARLERHYDPGVPEIAAFTGELNQVWTNLLDNALDAVPEQGLVKIETGRDGNEIWVRIIDDGPGIPKDVQPRIFEPFFTTKAIEEGTGLGLDVVARIVRLHQGHIDLESEPGRTAFTVHLPIEAPRYAAESAGAADNAGGREVRGVREDDERKESA